MRLWNVWGDLQHGGGVATTIAAIAAITTTTITNPSLTTITITDHCHNCKYQLSTIKEFGTSLALLLCQATTLVLGGEVGAQTGMSPMLGAGVDICLHLSLGLLWWLGKFGMNRPPPNFGLTCEPNCCGRLSFEGHVPNLLAPASVAPPFTQGVWMVQEVGLTWALSVMMLFLAYV